MYEEERLWTSIKSELNDRLGIISNDASHMSKDPVQGTDIKVDVEYDVKRKFDRGI